MKNHYIHLFLLTFILFIIASCGGGSGGRDTTAPGAPSSINVTATSNGAITVTGVVEPNSTVTVTFPDGSQKSAKADTNGNINFTLTSIPSQPLGEVVITTTDLSGNASAPTIVSVADVTILLYKATGTMPELAFKPSLGVNTEAPQGADTAGMPMPFVDIFRTARPFTDQSNSATIFDSNGWPTKFAPNLSYARTKLLQGALVGSIPNGKYTVLYENDNVNSHLEFGTGPVSNYQITAMNGKYEGSFDLTLQAFTDEEDEIEVSSKNAINLNIRGDSGDGTNTDLKNISIIMPGGTCSGNPFLKVSSVAECPTGVAYESFASQIKTNRNAIVFNPDYLLFLRNFKVIRMMNLMEASHGKAYCSQSDGCPNRIDTWANRATLDDAVWGGSDRTAYTERNGVPVEVLVALTNTLKRDIWVNMPHPANDDYITQFATYLKNNLNTSSKIYIEYSNEIWNSGFTGHDYVISKGKTAGLNANIPTTPYDFKAVCDALNSDDERDKGRCGNYFASLRYYSTRSSQVFALWDNVFGNSSRFIRVLGTSQGDIIRTDEMVKHIGQNNVDAIAMAPYFYGCAERKGLCADTTKVPKVFSEATTTDDIFSIIDQTYDDDTPGSEFGDPSSISGTIAKIKRQLNKTSSYSLKLLTYEGGQHLSTSILTHFITIPNIIDPRLNNAGIVDDVTRTAILTLLNENYTKITDSQALISSNANSDGTIVTREQKIIDKMEQYRVLSNAYKVKANDYLADNELVAGEASAMSLEYTGLNTKKAQVVEAQKSTYRKLFKAANRDPRMKARYESLLNGWKSLSSQGASLFTMYTLPQSYYRYGNWGLKEHLNSQRSKSPKFDAVMSFQETAEQCWWSSCTP